MSSWSATGSSLKRTKIRGHINPLKRISYFRHRSATGDVVPKPYLLSPEFDDNENLVTKINPT